MTVSSGTDKVDYQFMAPDASRGSQRQLNGHAGIGPVAAILLFTAAELAHALTHPPPEQWQHPYLAWSSSPAFILRALDTNY